MQQFFGSRKQWFECCCGSMPGLSLVAIQFNACGARHVVNACGAWHSLSSLNPSLPLYSDYRHFVLFSLTCFMQYRPSISWCLVLSCVFFSEECFLTFPEFKILLSPRTKSGPGHPWHARPAAMLAILVGYGRPMSLQQVEQGS